MGIKESEALGPLAHAHAQLNTTERNKNEFAVGPRGYFRWRAGALVDCFDR